MSASSHVDRKFETPAPAALNANTATTTIAVPAATVPDSGWLGHFLMALGIGLIAMLLIVVKR